MGRGYFTNEEVLMSESKKHVYHDLDSLAGTWTSEDLAEFEENMRFLEQIESDEKRD